MRILEIVQFYRCWDWWRSYHGRKNTWSYVKMDRVEKRRHTNMFYHDGQDVQCQSVADLYFFFYRIFFYSQGGCTFAVPSFIFICVWKMSQISVCLNKCREFYCQRYVWAPCFYVMSFQLGLCLGCGRVSVKWHSSWKGSDLWWWLHWHVNVKS